MSNSNINFKSIFEQPVGRLVIVFGGITLLLIILIWILSTQYDTSTTSLCLSITGDCNIIVPDPDPIIITPLVVGLVSGGISTIALGLLIGVGFLNLPIVFALAGGAAFATMTYSALQILY